MAFCLDHLPAYLLLKWFLPIHVHVRILCEFSITRVLLFSECPLDVRVERSRINAATSDRELFPSLRHGPSGPQHPQPPLALRGFRDEDRSPSHSDSYNNNPSFYDSSYGFSKEAIAGLITRGTDHSSAEPAVVEEVPPENSAYSNEYHTDFEKFHDLGKDSRNALRNEPNRYEAAQHLDSKFAGSHESPVNLFKTFIQQVQRNNRTSFGKEQPKRPLPAFDSPDYPYRFREGLNVNTFPKVSYNFQVSDVVEKHPNEVLKNQRFLGEQFGENVRTSSSVEKFKQGVNHQFSNPGSEDVSDNNREITALLKQSHALSEYLHRLRVKAEADLAGDTEVVREHPRQGGKSQRPSRGGRATFRGRTPNKYPGA